MDAKRRDIIMGKARAAGFDPSHLSQLEEILNETPPTSLAEEVADIVVDRMRVEGIEYFPQLPNILMNASNLSWNILRDLQEIRGGVDVFRTINADAAKAVLRSVSNAEGAAAKLADSLSQSSRLLTGEDLDESTEGEAATWLTTSTEESSPNRT